jgi:hypothetical protein
MGIFKYPQYADDWGFLNHRCLPTNVDGLTYHLVERKARFLLLEVKRNSEDMSTGQRIMLSALARIPQFTVILLHSRLAVSDDKNGRAVIPNYYHKMGTDGELGSIVMTTPEDFRGRYVGWFLGKDTF